MSKKIDLRKQLKHFYSSTKKPNIIDVPDAKFLTITYGERLQRDGRLS